MSTFCEVYNEEITFRDPLAKKPLWMFIRSVFSISLAPVSKWQKCLPVLYLRKYQAFIDSYWNDSKCYIAEQMKATVCVLSQTVHILLVLF